MEQELGPEIQLVQAQSQIEKNTDYVSIMTQVKAGEMLRG